MLTSGIPSKATGKFNLKPEQPENLSIIDIEKENRLSKIISLYSKGLKKKKLHRN
jgi:hypothetical protein